MRRSSSRAIRTALSARRARASPDSLRPVIGDQSAGGISSSGQRSCRFQRRSLMQPRARSHQALAMINQQTDIELSIGQHAPGASRGPHGSLPSRSRSRRSSQTCLAHETSRARPRSAWVRHARSAPRARAETAPGARDVPAILDRPHPLSARDRAPRPTTVFRRLKSRTSRSYRSPPPAPSTAAKVWVCLCGSVPITIIALVPPVRCH